MSWFKSKTSVPEIPKFGQKKPPLEPREEPMEVQEERDPSDSMILRFIKKLKGDDEDAGGGKE
jgi:hypothetical protein